MKTGLRLLLPMFFLLLLFACKKDEQYIPEAAVNLTIYVNDPTNLPISTIGGWKYFSGGYKGIVVYRKGQSEFVAYERCCPVRPEESASIVSVDTTNTVFLIDNSCSSKFLLNDGSTVSGPAIIPLRQYHTLYDGTTLRVTN